MKGHNPVAIANYFIENSTDGMTIMQLLKLSYIAHGFNLGLKDEPLSNEPVYAWEYGPVFPSIYNIFRSLIGYKSRYTKLKEPAKLIKGEGDFDSDSLKVMNLVKKIYGDFDGWQLSALTHKEDTPWYEIYNRKGGKDSACSQIPNDIIAQYFKEKIIDKHELATCL